MTQEQKDFLNLRHFPGVMNREQVARRLGYSPFEIDILVSGGKLTPLGKPKRNAKKVFATIEIERCIQDMEWLHRAQKTITEFWEKKNRSRKGHSFPTQTDVTGDSRSVRRKTSPISSFES